MKLTYKDVNRLKQLILEKVVKTCGNLFKPLEFLKIKSSNFNIQVRN